MLIYLDMCCLKRPFDDQSQPRIRLESEALLGLLAMEPDRIKFVRSAALLLENSLNPIPERAARVGCWLASSPALPLKDAVRLGPRVAELMQFGIKSFDALHIAAAEDAGAALFVTTDDRLIAAARRNQSLIRTRVVSLLESVKDLVL